MINFWWLVLVKYPHTNWSKSDLIKYSNYIWSGCKYYKIWTVSSIYYVVQLQSYINVSYFLEIQSTNEAPLCQSQTWHNLLWKTWIDTHAHASLTAILSCEPGLAGFPPNCTSPYILFNTIPPIMSFSERRRRDGGEGRRVDDIIPYYNTIKHTTLHKHNACNKKLFTT